MSEPAANRALHDGERRLLAATMRSHETFAAACGAGLSESLLLSAITRKLFRAQADHYSESPEPPGPDALRVRLGADAAAFDELDYAQPAEPETVPQLVAALQSASRERAIEESRRRAQVALAKGDVALARKFLDDADDLEREQRGNVIELRPRGPRIETIGVPEIFAPVPPTKWISEGLHIAAGRPTFFVAYGASAKTLSAQSKAVCFAAGRPIWGKFSNRGGRALHIDHEQGEHATRKRYQRLAIGHDIDPRELQDRLRLATFPNVYLDSAAAYDAYARACDGFDLVVIDALRGATPNSDENDSSIRAPIDVLTRVSEATGAAFVVIHHAGKPKDGHADARTIARGSSAIFDACGCVLVLVAGKTGKDPRRVSQVKTPADAEGAPIDDFMLAVEDVEHGGNRTAGVRVVWQPIEKCDPAAVAGDEWTAKTERVLAYVKAHPDVSKRELRASVGMSATVADSVIAELVEVGELAEIPGARGRRGFRIGGHRV